LTSETNIAEPVNGFELGYRPALDGLRGVAILAVMAFNGHLAFVRGGFVGVDMFFALSGFLITCVLLQAYSQTSSIRLKDFYVRRALRLLPALFLLIACFIAYALIFQDGDRTSTTLRGVVYTVFYVANWAQVPPMPPGIGLLSHAWSLSVEEQFYILWPLLLILLLKLKNKRLVLAILGFLTAISILTSVLLWNAGAHHLRLYFGSDVRAHELLIGCMAALLFSWGAFQQTPRLKRTLHAASGISLVAILLSFYLVRYDEAFVYNGGFTLVAVATTLLILDLLLFPSRLSRLFEIAPLVWIGKISYGLYLWHFPVFEISRKLFEGRLGPVPYQTAGVLATLLIAAASYYFLEQPFHRLGRNWGSKPTNAPLLTSESRAATI
jgi:peptidoglycan/LPS O-acetylase OafA/YrhL